MSSEFPQNIVHALAGQFPVRQHLWLWFYMLDLCHATIISTVKTCMLWVQTMQPFSHHADWQPVNLSKTLPWTQSDNFLYVSTGRHKIVSPTNVAPNWYQSFTIALRLVNPRCSTGVRQIPNCIPISFRLSYYNITVMTSVKKIITSYSGMFGRQPTRRLEHLTACYGHVLGSYLATMQTGIQWKSTKHSLCIGWTISCVSVVLGINQHKAFAG